MAIDREKLLAFFQEHYLSRQEVFCKLPLNVPIESFWNELVNRRKAKATLLPLYGASCMPYWYVLTQQWQDVEQAVAFRKLGVGTLCEAVTGGMMLTVVRHILVNKPSWPGLSVFPVPVAGFPEYLVDDPHIR